MRVIAAQMNPTIGDFAGNTAKIFSALAAAREAGADLVVFPELAITGYPPQDLLLHEEFLAKTRETLDACVKASHGLGVVIGLPREENSSLYNSAAVIMDGELLGYQDKILLPTYDVFDERRYFAAGGEAKVWPLCGQEVGISICEDIWRHHGLVEYPRDPVSELKERSPKLLLNLSASPFSVAKPKRRMDVCRSAALSLGCPVILCNQVGGADSLIFDGYSVHVDGKGNVVTCAKGFEEDLAVFDTAEKAGDWTFQYDAADELHRALVLGVRDYFSKQGFHKAALGLSGGIDSAVVACLAVEALGPGNVLGVAMPSRYTSPESARDSVSLAKNLGIALTTISIEKPLQSYLDLLQPEWQGKGPDSTEENIQARIRGMILMALSNKLGYIVLSTGNKSEMAMGYATLYGDMCGGLGVISDVTKDHVYSLARYINRSKEVIPHYTIAREPSAELRPNQKDSDTLPSYDIIDTVVREYVEEFQAPRDIADKHGFPLNVVEDIVLRIHKNEYKRRQAPPGLRVTEKAFAVGRRFPIVQKWV